MLDFTRLSTPADDGQTLVLPKPADWIRAARENHESLRRAQRPLLDSTLAQWRSETRKAIVGRDDVLVFVIGHQPEFIHPGVWAKHIAAVEAARAVDGLAVNLVVDNDAPKHTALRLPAVTNDGLAVRSIPCPPLMTGTAYEQLPCQSKEETERFERDVREQLADRYPDSMMPTYFKGLAELRGSYDWVDQTVHARRRVEQCLGVTLEDRRISRFWEGPLLWDMLAGAPRFAACYNGALQAYRRTYKIRGSQRPIPDLHCEENRIEVPVWVYRAQGPRHRLFVSPGGGALGLFADRTPIGELAPGWIDSAQEGSNEFISQSGWRMRPRALALTIWARLMVADLFIHGIGGAKYDRISDAVIADYYGLTPPHMACVSATLHMGLPYTATTEDAIRTARQAIRDLAYNPQRHLPPGPQIDALLEQRAQTVRWALDLQERDRTNRRARRTAFERLRSINASLLSARPNELADRRRELAQAQRDLQVQRIATDREYFFGLYSESRLAGLRQALPDRRSFLL